MTIAQTRRYLASAWVSLVLAFVGTVLVDAIAGAMIVFARCPDWAFTPHPYDFVCSQDGVSEGFTIGTMILSAAVLMGATSAAMVFGVVAARRRGADRWPQSAAFFIAVLVSMAAAACAGTAETMRSADSTTAAGAVTLRIRSAAAVGALGVLIVGPCLALVAHVIARRLAKTPG